MVNEGFLTSLLVFFVLWFVGQPLWLAMLLSFAVLLAFGFECEKRRLTARARKR